MSTVSGLMFEAAENDTWRSIHKKPGAHYNVYSAVTTGMDGLRMMFTGGEADEMNFCLFSTSGVHGTYTTIEEVEAFVMRGERDEYNQGPDEVTFLIVQPRIVCTRYGNVAPKTAEDFEFLKKLRASSWGVVRKIGAAE